MSRVLTAADVATADPRKLAEALRPALDRMVRYDYGHSPAAAALLAVLDDAVKWYNTAMSCESILQAEDGIRAAAAAWLKAGGELDVE